MHLANMRDTLHVDHLRVDLQGVQVGKRLPAILARVLIKDRHKDI